MPRTLTVFRTLLVGAFALGIVGGALDMVFRDLLPSDLAEVYEAYEPVASAHGFVLMLLGLVLLVVDVVSSIGLLMLKRWARSLALWFTLLGLTATPFMGATLSSGWAGLLLDASMLLWGAALAMAYFSDLKRHFEPASAPGVPASG